LAKKQIADDSVFSDGTDHQLAALTGRTASGYVATISLGVVV
jgi:hypothetical protein